MYDFFFNSPFANRGVGIAIKKGTGLIVKNQLNDRTGNLLILNVAHNSDPEQKIIGTLISVYGPNDNSGDFYHDLNEFLPRCCTGNIIMGGDFNATWDISNPEQNIDVINMRNIPSRIRTERILEISQRFGLAEPFRYLYPNKIDFSYIPNAVANQNRSRIDFFLVSKEITGTGAVVDSGIITEKLSSLFDHKCVFLSIGKKKIKKDFNKVNDGILENDIIKLVVELTVKESYLNNADPESLPRFTKNVLKSEIGRVFFKLAAASNLELDAARHNNLNDNLRAQVHNLIRDASDIAETLPALEFFEDLPLTVEPDTFFEGLILSVKNEILTKQSAIFKLKNTRKRVLRENIWQLKGDYKNNFEEIHRQERILNAIVEQDLRKELENYKIFERLNQEKITPHFMNLVRNDCKQNQNLNEIKDTDGSDFNTEAELGNYITEFYRELYSKPEDEPILTGNSIPDFLGVVAEHPAVQNSKLNNDEKDRLDQELTLQEFDKAVQQSKLNSSPGIDGLSNKFIKKFWQYFRKPLFNYTTFCFDAGRLTENFRTAKIRLIPKKSDPKKIGNWRPISLLNCFYKLISRVLTNRLKSVIDKITRVGQKSYSNSKWCQEVVISLYDKIFNARSKTKTGCIVSLDIKKAFDSISHNYMVESLRFFNFGEKFIGWVKTICTNRKACIILNTGTGNTFDLERGNAQGDVISPFIFNICYQILLFKIEFNLQIEQIIVPDTDQYRQDPEGAPEPVSHITKKVYAFADDCNILAALTPETLREIKNVLTDFGVISGLVCNVQKSHVLPVGFNPQVNDEIINSGFEITDELTVLGFKINNKDCVFDTNAEIIINKLNAQKRIWDRYNLSLPGRINICKTMFVSQINYTGCVIPISDENIIRIEQIISDFVRGNLRISKERVFSPVKSGGLGLFDIRKFIDSQICSWVRRSTPADSDWKLRLLNAGSGNLHLLSPEYFQGTSYPISTNIARAYANFIKKFTQHENNFKCAFIINNQALTCGIRNRNNLKTADLQHITNDIANLSRLYNLRMTDLIADGRKISKAEFNRNFNIEISQEKWQLLDKIRNAALLRYGRDDPKPVTQIEHFINRWKKGSKKIRNILCSEQNEYIPHNMVKFADNTETVIGLDTAKYLNRFWNRSYFSNDLRTFIFKLHNNTLPVNTILSHFVRGCSRNCTFCDIRGNPDVEDENILHFFFNCDVSERLRFEFFNWLTNRDLNNISRREFFCGFRKPNNYYNEVLNTACKLFMKFLWDCRLRKTIPHLEGLKTFISDEFDTMAKASRFFKNTILHCGHNISETLGIGQF
jgi:exonuclease III